MKKAEKQTFVDELTSELKNASSIVLIDYTGISVKSQQELKKRLKAVDASMLVVKNTLLKIAGRKAETSEDALTDSVLSGQTALVVSKADPIAPLQVLYRFAKEFELPQLKVGIVEGKFQDKVALTKLSTLPSKEILLGQTVGTIASPLYGIVGVLNANMQKLVYILSEHAKSQK
jgi:large subunit ribosomal protein L10